MRPQFGSQPNHAVLQSGEFAMARAASSASFSFAAPGLLKRKGFIETPSALVAHAHFQKHARGTVVLGKPHGFGQERFAEAASLMRRVDCDFKQFALVDDVHHSCHTHNNPVKDCNRERIAGR